MATIKEMRKYQIVLLQRSFGIQQSGWCVVTAIDLQDKTAKVWFVGQDSVSRFPNIPFRLFRVATHDDAVEYLKTIFQIDPLSSVVIAHENNLTNDFVLSLMYQGISKETVEDMPSLQSAMRLLQNPILFQRFIDAFDTAKPISSKSEVLS